jgi:MFS family permease
VFLALRVEEPIVDIRALSRPLLLTLLAVVLAAGSFQAMITLAGLVAKVPSELGLGYGLGGLGPSALVFAAPAPGIALGGILAGWLAGRIGPARTLLGGIAIGTAATFTMLAGVSSFPLMIASVALLGLAAGAIGTSGFNLATGQAPPERHGVVSGLVSVMLAVGGAVVTVAGTAALNATTTEVAGAPQHSATGVHLYVLIGGILFALATVTATVLARRRSAPRRTPRNAEASARTQVTAAHRAAPPTRHREPTPAGGVLQKPAQLLVAGVGGVLFVGMAMIFGTQILTAEDGTALLGSRQVAVGPDQERVEVGALFGNVDVVVPDGVRVRVGGRVVFGGTECELACSGAGREVVVDAVGAFAMVDVMRPGEILADEREEAREDAEDAAEDARERAEDARDGG